MKIEGKFEGIDFIAEISERFTYLDGTKWIEIVKFVETNKIPRVILDFSNLDFIDSSGVGMLLVLNETLMRFNGKLVITNQKNQVARVLRVTKILELL